MEKIEWTMMWQDLGNIHTFVEEKYTDEKLRSRLLPILLEAYEDFRSTLRIFRLKEKLRRIDKALAALKRASIVEKRRITARKKKILNDLYGGSSPTPYSDLLEAQKAFPDRPYIWAFEKKLKEFRKQVVKK